MMVKNSIFIFYKNKLKRTFIGKNRGGAGGP